MNEPNPQILLTSIEHEMRTSFIDYAMSVIVSRALPNIRDGLKPVHRRILYTMHELKNFYTQPYKKSARVVGDVMGRFHPHGDQAIYDALVRMAQEFSLRYPLADGQGNFGSIDGDPAAAMRYTEVRMGRIGGEMLADIEKETVTWSPNYDEKEQEPDYLPARLPNLLVNGAQGIAVGMATNIPPHNVAEVVDATVALVRNPQISLAELMEILPGPDFPTAGLIYGRAGILQAYKTGRGSVVMRGRTVIEEDEKRKKSSIIVNELPYQVNKARLLEKIAALVKEKRLSGITDLRDESDRHGIRMVIELRRDAVPEVVLNQLYKLTPLQDTFGVNVLAIVEGQPRLLTLVQVLESFVDHRRDVVTRRTQFELREARKRAHILEGLKIALDNLDEVIALIRASENPPSAKAGLMQRFGLSAEQSQAILDMRLQRLTGLERDKILQELAELMQRIEYLLSLLADPRKLMEVVVQELLDLKAQYGDARRTEIVDATGEIGIEDLIPEEDMVVTVTHSGYIKRCPISLYRAQKRGGRGITGISTDDEDFVRELFVANSHDYILLFTNTGRVFRKRVYDIPQAGRASRGRAMVNLLELRPEEYVLEMLAVDEFREGRHVMMATRNGVVKKTPLMDFRHINVAGIIAITIEEGDKLMDVRLTDGSMHVMLCSEAGMVIRFPEEHVRTTGRTSRGVRGIKLREGDRLVQMSVLLPESEATLAMVCEHGYGKRTAVAEFTAQNRGGLGVIGIKTTERNGLLTGAQVVEEGHQLMLITSGGKVIRMPVSDISVIGRNTQGVRLVRLEEGERVMAMERLAEEDSGEEGPADGEGGEGEDLLGLEGDGLEDARRADEAGAADDGAPGPAPDDPTP